MPLFIIKILIINKNILTDDSAKGQPLEIINHIFPSPFWRGKVIELAR
jgi:hypothetical protein